MKKAILALLLFNSVSAAQLQDTVINNDLWLTGLGTVTFEGATTDTNQTVLTVVDPTTDKTITLPDATDTLVGKATTDTLRNKTFNGFTLNGTTISLPALTQGDILFAKTTSTVNRLAKGTNHYALKVNGNALVWEPDTGSAASLPSWSVKTANFLAVAGGKYLVTKTCKKVTLPVSAGTYDEIWVKPQINTDFTVNGMTMNGTPTIAGAASSSYLLDENVLYIFVSNGGAAYDVAGSAIAR